jgi:DNA topoisomerase IB
LGYQHARRTRTIATLDFLHHVLGDDFQQAFFAFGRLDAGLRYVSNDQPGYTRKAKGDDFEYFDTEGKPIRDVQRLLRIKRLAIPPAYTDVWICPSTNGHIQAMGRDARRRKQYRYHQRWRAARDENKLISRSR